MARKKAEKKAEKVSPVKAVENPQEDACAAAEAPADAE